MMKAHDFVSFVLSEIGSTPIQIAKYYHQQISNLAAEAGIDWSETEINIAYHLNKTVYRGRDGVVGLTGEDKYRVYVVPTYAEYKDKKPAANQTATFQWPIITFANARQSYIKKLSPNDKGNLGTNCFNALPLMWAEFETYKAGNYVSKPIMAESYDQKRAAALKAQQDSRAAMKVELEKDIALISQLSAYATSNHSSCYLTDKAVDSIARQTDLRFGSDSKGFFIAFPLIKVTGAVAGLQRIYDKPYSNNNRKKVTWGADTNGAFYIIGDTPNADVVYICEGLATALSMHEATGRPCVIAQYNTNLPAVNSAMAFLYPKAKRVVVADNDCHNVNNGNSGLYWALEAVKQFGGFVFCPITGDGTDANDVHRVVGISVLQKQIKSKANYWTQREAISVGGIFNVISQAA
ncbi:phage/plasmid primase-like uncharacterized protein [Rheinheimera pacifica]|uniref:toprim domain-containing protein n=1 Tax=Rheinheimera pacifica TaxID=173990 RepID=UPI00216824D2|nr:toprim domain-containing protein [Rheinheimera pacifica]MCS4309476.1 phage/plasmid primase-like uncharacterized protein [Rheinheimera pacifica]